MPYLFEIGCVILGIIIVILILIVLSLMSRNHKLLTLHKIDRLLIDFWQKKCITLKKELKK